MINVFFLKFMFILRCFSSTSKAQIITRIWAGLMCRMHTMIMVMSTWNGRGEAGTMVLGIETSQKHITLGFQGHLGFGMVWLDNSKQTYQSNIKPQEVWLENICHSRNGWAHRHFRVRLKPQEVGWLEDDRVTLKTGWEHPGFRVRLKMIPKPDDSFLRSIKSRKNKMS